MANITCLNPTPKPQTLNPVSQAGDSWKFLQTETEAVSGRGAGTDPVHSGCFRRRMEPFCCLVQIRVEGLGFRVFRMQKQRSLYRLAQSESIGGCREGTSGVCTVELHRAMGSVPPLSSPKPMIQPCSSRSSNTEPKTVR